jgi:hypothetical protein
MVVAMNDGPSPEGSLVRGALIDPTMKGRKMKRKLPLTFVALWIASLLVGCGPNQQAAETQPESTPATSASTGAPVPTSDSSQTATPASEVSLEDILPDELAGVELHKTTVSSADLPTVAADFSAVVFSVTGGSVDGADAEVVVVREGGPDGPLVMRAMRLPGIDSEDLRTALLDLSADSSAETIAGKDVVTRPSAAGVFYNYFFDDVWFDMFTEEPALAEEVLADLP